MVKRLILIVAVIVTVVVSLITLPSFLRDRFGPALRGYVSLLREGDTVLAYSQVCSSVRERLTLDQFRARYLAQIDEIGPIKSLTSFRGSKSAGSFLIEGQRMTVLAVLPAEREGGEWRPCPSGDPLGEFRSPP